MPCCRPIAQGSTTRQYTIGGSWFWPLLGTVFLPFTTLMYVILWSPTGLAGWDWFWLVMAVVVDVMHYSSTAYSNRNQISGYKPAATTPTTPPPPQPM